MAHKRKPKIYVGCKVRFDPSKHLVIGSGESMRGKLVTGVIRYINQRHRWFLVEYCDLRTCFHFASLGDEVFVGGT